MVALKGNDIVSFPLKDVVGKQKVVESQVYESGRTYFR